MSVNNNRPASRITGGLTVTDYKKMGLIEARQKLNEIVNAYLKRAMTTVEHAALKCDTGLGKSTATQKALPSWMNERKAAGKPHKIIWAVPHHRLSNEALADFQALNIKVAVWRGREANNPDAIVVGEAMCRNIEAVQSVQAAMGDVGKMVCGTDKGPQCPFRSTCAYVAQKQEIKKADVVVVAHELLFQPGSLGGLDQYGLVVIDETFYHCGFPKDIFELDADNLVVRTKAMPSRDWRDQEKLINQIKKFKTHIAATKGEKYFTKEFVNKMWDIDFGEMSKIEWSRKIELDIHPGMPIAAIKLAAVKGKTNQEIGKRAAMWKILEGISKGEQMESRLRILVEEQDDKKSRTICMNLLKPIHPDILKLPILYLDATPTLNIAKSFIPDLKMIEDIRVETPNMHITHILGTFGKAMIPVPSDNHKNAKEKQVRINKLIALIESLNGVKLVITYKDLEAYFQNLADVQTAHFNALAGLDCFGSVDHLIVIGRPFAPSTAVHQLAECFTGQVFEYENPVNMKAGIAMRDGANAEIEVKDYQGQSLRDVKYAITDAEVIQAIGRPRGVNRTSANPVTVYLFSDVAAPHEVDRVVTFKDLFLSNTKTQVQRNKKYMDKRKIAQLIEGLSSLNGITENDVTKSHIDILYGNLSQEMPSSASTKQPLDIQVDLFEKVNSSKPFYSERLDHERFVEFLRACSVEQASGIKDKNSLFSPAIFDPKMPGVKSKRAILNIKYLDGIWLDNDGGDLLIEEFIRIFPEWKMYVFNSVSSGKVIDGKPIRKWRCYIPLAQYLTVASYKHIMKIIEARLAESGYFRKAQKLHGFDPTKFSAHSMFFLPCKSGYGDSFFHEYVDGRALFDPVEVIQKIDVEEEDEIIVAKPTPNLPQVSPRATGRLTKLQERLLADAVARRRQMIKPAYDRCLARRAGDGNTALFVFAARMQEAGFSAAEARGELSDVARQMRSPSERKAQIPGLLKQLW
jgi:hypothetical protein